MTEKIPNENEPKTLGDFKREVAELKKKEEENLNEKGGRKTVHFQDINPEELDETDQRIYDRLLEKKLTVAELRSYQSELYKHGSKSQQQFSAYLGNLLFVQMYKKEK